MLVTTEYYDEQVVDDVIAHSTTTFNGILEAVSMGLITGDFAPSKTSAYADITQPTYPGYALQACVFGSPRRDEEGNIGTEGPLIPWQMSDATVPTLVKGYFICTTASPKLLWAEVFAVGVSLNDALSYLGVVPVWNASNLNPGSAQIIA